MDPNRLKAIPILLERAPRSADVIATSPMVVMKLTHWEIRRMSNETLGRIQEVVAKRRESGSRTRLTERFSRFT